MYKQANKHQHLVFRILADSHPGGFASSRFATMMRIPILENNLLILYFTRTDEIQCLVTIVRTVLSEPAFSWEKPEPVGFHTGTNTGYRLPISFSVICVPGRDKERGLLFSVVDPNRLYLDTGTVLILKFAPF